MFLSAFRFCDDNENPRHPGTFLLLTVDQEENDDISSKSWLKTKLRAHWSNNDDEVAPILSRVANNWVTLAAEKPKPESPFYWTVVYGVVGVVVVKMIISALVSRWLK